MIDLQVQSVAVPGVIPVAENRQDGPDVATIYIPGPAGISVLAAAAAATASEAAAAASAGAASTSASEAAASASEAAASALQAEDSAAAAAANAAVLESMGLNPALGVDLCNLLRANTSRGSCYAIKDANRSLFGVGIATNGPTAAEIEFTADNDDLWRVRYGYTNELDGPLAMLWTGRTITIYPVMEFAILATPSGSEFTEDWVPAHGSETTGAIVVNSRKLYIDGTERPDDLSDWVSGTAFEIEELVVTQDYTAYNTADTEQTTPMWNGVLTHKFNRDGLTISHVYKTLTDVLVTFGYATSLSGRISAWGEMRLDNGYSRTIVTPGVGQNAYEPGYARSAIAFNTTTGNAAAMSVDSWMDSTSEGEVWKETGYPMLLTERSDGISKLYFVQAGRNLVIPSGTLLRSVVTIFQAAGFPLKGII